MRRLLLAVVTALVIIIGAAAAANATLLRGATVITGPDATCSDGYMIHAGGTVTTVQQGSYKFRAVHTAAGWDDPYITTGYNQGLNSGYYCKDKATWQPVKAVSDGYPVVGLHTLTSGDFRGDTGLDLWFEPSASDVNYTQMVNGGNNSTEIMVWTSHPGLGTQSSSLGYYPYLIDGKRWQITVGTAGAGHGKTSAHPGGWTVVNFIAPSIHRGNVTINSLHLNQLISYAMNRGWLSRSDYLMSVNAGSELTQGKVAVSGYTLSGLK